MDAPAGNQVVEQARKGGINTCLPAITMLSEGVIGNAAHGAHSSLSPRDSDKQLFSTVIETETSRGAQLSIIDVAPVVAGDCTATYEQVQWFDAPCLVVAQETFPDYAYKGVLKSRVVRLEGGATVYLYPAGQGCLALKKQEIAGANMLRKQVPAKNAEQDKPQKSNTGSGK